MSERAKKLLLTAAEVGLVVVILALLAANWIPIMVGARWYRGMP